MNQEQLFNVYAERFCTEADFVYRFSAAVTLNEREAHRITHEAFKKVANTLAQHAEDESPAFTLAVQAAREILANQAVKPAGLDHLDPVVSELAHIKDRRARLAFVASDVCGFSPEETSVLLSGSRESVKDTAQLLAAAREAFYGSKNQTFPAVIWAHLAEAVDEEVPAAVAGEFEKARKAVSSFDDLASVFRLRRGQVQLAVQHLNLSAQDVDKLRNLVASVDVRHTQEAQRIEEISSFEARGRFMRQLAFAGVALAVVFFVVYKGAPRKSGINVLEVLSYESLALVEDGKERLDLPSDNIEEVKEYLGSYPELGFRPKVLTAKSAGMSIEGATVLDYDSTKVSVVLYTDPNKRDRILHYTLSGETGDLPKAEPGNFQGLIYQTYASDRLNMIAWNPAPGVLSIAAGTRGATDLADFVRKGSLGM
ncbi:MAG: hypothetical protein RIQ81_1636 [Pseudomonadota bacterium]|jgi:hypothetical protein